MKKYIISLVAITLCFVSGSFAKKAQQPDSYAYTRGVEAYSQYDYSEALDWFDREVSDHPDNGYAYYYIASIQSVYEEYGLSLSAINNAIKNLPKKDKVWYSSAIATRANIYLALEDTVRAIGDLNQAIKIDGSNKKFYNFLGQIYCKQKKYDLSDANYQKMIEFDAGDVMGYMGLGCNASDQEEWSEAIEQFNKVVKLSPDYSSGYSYRAKAYIGMNEWDKATDDIVKALEISSDDQMALYLLQFIPEDASDLLKIKLKIQMAKHPNEWLWPYSLGYIAQSCEDYSEAISYFEKAHSLDANTVFLEQIANCYFYQSNFTKALDYANRALDMSPENYNIVALKADILSGMGRYDECLTERDRYIAHYPDNSYAYFSKADDCMNAHRFEEAIEDFNTSIALLPTLKDYPYLLMRRGDAYRFTGKQTEAERDYNALIRVEADTALNADSWTPFAYSGLKKAKEAIESMQYIIDNDTTNRADNYYNLACVYARLGQNDDAVQALKTAFQHGCKSLVHLQNDYDLDGLRDREDYRQLVDSMAKVIDVSSDETGAVDDTSSAVYETVEVPFTKENGITKVKCTINDLPLHFVFDTGAAEVTISMVEANFMLKNDYIKQGDIIGSARYIDANGDISEGTVINLRQVNFGGFELENVRASVVRNQRAPLLLGQSVLGRLGKIEIDNPGMKLKITHKK